MNRKSPAPTLRPRAAIALSLVTGLFSGLSLVAAAPALAQDDEAGDPPIETSAEDSAEKSTRASKGAKRLARMLEGRVAGEPQNCIRNMPTDRMTTIHKTAYVFGRGNTIFVQRTTRPRQINDRETLVTRRFGSAAQLCRQDVATTIDPLSQIFTGAVMFEDFVPYTRSEDEEG